MRQAHFSAPGTRRAPRRPGSDGNTMPGNARCYVTPVGVQTPLAHRSALSRWPSAPAVFQAISSFSSARHSAGSQAPRPSWRTPCTAASSGASHADPPASPCAACRCAACAARPSAPPCKAPANRGSRTGALAQRAWYHARLQPAERRRATRLRSLRGAAPQPALPLHRPAGPQQSGFRGCSGRGLSWCVSRHCSLAPHSPEPVSPEQVVASPYGRGPLGPAQQSPLRRCIRALQDVTGHPQDELASECQGTGQNSISQQVPLRGTLCKRQSPDWNQLAL